MFSVLKDGVLAADLFLIKNQVYIYKGSTLYCQNTVKIKNLLLIFDIYSIAYITNTNLFQRLKRRLSASLGDFFIRNKVVTTIIQTNKTHILKPIPISSRVIFDILPMMKLGAPDPT